MRRLLIVLIIMLTFISVAAAQSDVFHRNTTKSDANLISDTLSVSYTDLQHGIAFTDTINIDGSVVPIHYVSQNPTHDIWGTGNGAGNSDILIEHDYKHDVGDDVLKGTITIKTPHAITFPYTVSAGSNIAPYNGGFKIQKNRSAQGLDTGGIIIPAPSATNKTGGVVPVWYTYDATKITLNINDANQEYPLVIDPTYYVIAGTLYSNGIQFNITASASTGALTNYPIMVNVTNLTCVSSALSICTNGTTRVDWRDIAFTTSADAAIPFWVENNTATATNATIWINPPTVATTGTTYRMYYGNATQTTSTMDGQATFTFWDDMLTAASNKTNWVPSGTGSVVNSGGIMNVTGGSSAWEIAYTNTTTGYNFAKNTSARFLWKADAESNRWGIGLASLDGNYQANIYIDPTTAKYYQVVNGGTTTQTSRTTTDTTFTVGEVAWNKTPNVKFYEAGALKATSTTNSPTSSMLGVVQAYSTSRILSVDWYVVRPYREPEPTTTSYTGVPSATSSPVASFTSGTNPSVAGNAVTFTDTSTNTPTTWNWSFDNRTTWSNGTTQNQAHVFAATGAFNVTLVCNNTVGASNPYDLTQIVQNASGFNRQDVEQTGQYIASFPITDSSTGAAIPVVIVTTSDGQSYTTANGTAIFTQGMGVYVAYFSATGYTSKSVSYIVDGDASTAVQLVPASDAPGTYNTYPPKDVKFHITSFFGSPIPGASVSILGITTSTGNWDWLVTLLGIPLDSVAINGTAMTETTDSNGDVVFLMVPSVKYNVSVTASGYTFPDMIIAPQASVYPIAANWNESWFSSGNDTLKDVNVSVSWVRYNDTYSFVNITYDDQTMTTTGGTISVYRDSAGRVANESAIKTMAIVSSSCSNSTLVNTPTGGASYRVLVNATTTDQNIVRTFTHYFKGSPVMLPGWTSETLLWLALFCVIFTAAFAGAIHSPQMAIVLCVESWVFWAIGWLDALITQFWYGEASIIGVLTLASFIAILWNITEGKSKGKRSS